MDTQRLAPDLPEIITVTVAELCRCGEALWRGERVGYRAADGRTFCLRCMVDLQVGRAPLDLVFAAPASAHTERTEHSRSVAQRADDLSNRLMAARTLGTLTSAVQPLHVQRRG